MKKNKNLLASILLCLASTQLFAATLTLQTRSIDDPASISDSVLESGYRTTWSNQRSTISTQGLTEFDNLSLASNGTVKSVFAYFKTTFSIDEDSASKDWGFRVGLDAGHGAAIYLDGDLINSDTSDLWWKYNWNNSSEILSRTDLDLLAGNHLLEIFWAESCCHGRSDAQFTTDGNNWNTLSKSNLETAGKSNLVTVSAVPLPMAVWLFGSGVITLVATRKYKHSSANIA